MRSPDRKHALKACAATEPFLYPWHKRKSLALVFTNRLLLFSPTCRSPRNGQYLHYRYFVNISHKYIINISSINWNWLCSKNTFDLTLTLQKTATFDFIMSTSKYNFHLALIFPILQRYCAFLVRLYSLSSFRAITKPISTHIVHATHRYLAPKNTRLSNHRNRTIPPFGLVFFWFFALISYD